MILTLRPRIEAALADFLPERRAVSYARVNQLLEQRRGDRPFRFIRVEPGDEDGFALRFERCVLLPEQAMARLHSPTPFRHAFEAKAVATVVRALLETQLGPALVQGFGPEQAVAEGHLVRVNLSGGTLARLYQERLADLTGHEVPILGVMRLPEIYQLHGIEVTARGFRFESVRSWQVPSFLPVAP